jgi:integrase
MMTELFILFFTTTERMVTSMANRKTTRAAQGSGTIRQRKDGRWEARYTVGRNPGTGKQIQKSVYGATQKEVVKKLQQTQTDIERGAYTEPSKMTLGAWLDIWVSEYTGHVKPNTRDVYASNITNRIKPDLGLVPLQKLQPHQIQTFYNKIHGGGLSPGSVRHTHAVLHSALEQAVKLGYIKGNPAAFCVLPRLAKKEVKIMPDEKVSAFLEAITADPFEAVFYVDLFTGMRQGEILGLTWECVDFDAGTILIDKQLSDGRGKDGTYFLDTTKYDKTRRIKPAALVMDKLRAQRLRQNSERLRAGAAWSNPWNLVFTNEWSGYLPHRTVFDHFKKIVAGIGEPDLTFHGMRHSYAVLSLMNGDDAKTVQENLGHHSAAFTLDTYVHVTEKMKEDSANRMERFIRSVDKA